MKNIVNIDTKVVCWHWDCNNKKGFYSFNFSFIMTCPRCEKQTDEEDTNGIHFCEDCGIIFDAFGCPHKEEYNAHFIGKYEYEGIIYNGMPLFESLEEWKNKIGDIMILKWICPNGGCLKRDL